MFAVTPVGQSGACVITSFTSSSFTLLAISRRLRRAGFFLFFFFFATVACLGLRFWNSAERKRQSGLQQTADCINKVELIGGKKKKKKRLLISDSSLKKKKA